MKRASHYLLLTCFAFAGFQAGAKASGAPLPAPSAFAHYSDADVDKYNRKLKDLEVKRARDHQKLEAEYAKLLQKRQNMDLRKFQERLDKFRIQRDKIEKKYQLKLQKLERERARRG